MTAFLRRISRLRSRSSSRRFTRFLAPAMSANSFRFSSSTSITTSSAANYTPVPFVLFLLYQWSLGIKNECILNIKSGTKQ